MGKNCMGILQLAFLCLIIACQSDPIGKSHEKNNLIVNALGLVSKENIYRTVEGLHNYETRYSWEKQQEVADYLFKRFQEYGIPVEFDEYYFRGKKWKNVIATINGRKNSGDNYMVIAHFDSVSKQPEVSAPGADDNASGCAAVLEIGRVLREMRLNSTVILGIFSNEEQGAAGSKHFARKARENGLDLKAVFNLDIIGYNDSIAKATFKPSQIGGLMGALKMGLKTIRNYKQRFLYPDGIVVIGGRPPNQALVEMASALVKNYSKLKEKPTVGKDCG